MVSIIGVQIFLVPISLVLAMQQNQSNIYLCFYIYNFFFKKIHVSFTSFMSICDIFFMKNMILIGFQLIMRHVMETLSRAFFRRRHVTWVSRSRPVNTPSCHNVIFSLPQVKVNIQNVHFFKIFKIVIFNRPYIFLIVMRGTHYSNPIFPLNAPQRKQAKKGA